MFRILIFMAIAIAIVHLFKFLYKKWQFLDIEQKENEIKQTEQKHKKVKEIKKRYKDYKSKKKEVSKFERD